MVANHWFMKILKVLKAMEITSDTTRIRLAAFQLEGEAQVWWNWENTSRDIEAMTWAEFQELLWVSIFRILLVTRRLRSPKAEAGDDDCDGLCG